MDNQLEKKKSRLLFRFIPIGFPAILFSFFSAYLFLIVLTSIISDLAGGENPFDFWGALFHITSFCLAIFSYIWAILIRNLKFATIFSKESRLYKKVFFIFNIIAAIYLFTLYNYGEIFYLGGGFPVFVKYLEYFSISFLFFSIITFLFFIIKKFIKSGNHIDQITKKT
jgi:hypothetical protein